MATVTIATRGLLFLTIVSVVLAVSKIFPGTKWCGHGDRAKNYSDLGRLRDLDSCCRTHDHCSRNIHAGETKWGITDNANFTWSDCKCDYALRDCLQEVDTRSADAVAGIYFVLFKNAPCVRFEANGTPTYKSRFSDLMKTVIDALLG